MVMRKISCNRDAMRSMFIALMLLSPIASASDFRGFITIFVGFPSIIFCDLVLGVLLIEVCLGARKFISLILLPFFVVAFLLFLCIVYMNGMLVLDVFRRPHGVKGWGMSMVMLTSLVCSSIAIVLLFFSSSNEDGKNKRRKRVAWVTVTLATATSLLVAFDFYVSIEKSHSDWSLAVPYLFFFGMALVLHGLVIRLPSRRN